MTDKRLLACLPTIGQSIGTTGIPESNLVRLAGPDVISQLHELQSRGLVVQLPSEGWAETDHASH